MHRLYIALAVLSSSIASADIKYRILKREPYDAPIKTQITYRVLVEEEATTDQLKELLSKLYRQAKAETGFKNRKHPSHVFIYLYPTMDHAEDGSTWSAMLDDTGNGPEISINDRVMAGLKSDGSVKHGLSEERRKIVFKWIVKAEDVATKKADEKFGTPIKMTKEFLDKKLTWEEKATKYYKGRVAKDNGITMEQLGEIGTEGITKGWPMK